MPFDSPAPQALTVYAEHGFGGARMNEPTTFLFWSDRDLDRAGWIDGHIQEGSIIPAGFGHPARRVVMRGAAA